MPVTVDASVAVKWFIEEPGTEIALSLLEMDEQLIAPELIVSEVSNAVWRRASRGDIERDQATRIPMALIQVLSQIVPMSDLIDEAMTIAFAVEHTVYDCIYLALARERGSPLATADARLLKILSTSDWRDFNMRLF